MSFLSKAAAVIVGVGSTGGALAIGAVSQALEMTSEQFKKQGRSVTTSSGRVYTSADYHKAADKSDSLAGDIFNKGWKEAKNLWNED